MNLSRYFLVMLILLLLASGKLVSAKDPSQRPAFVLVHGAWHGGWCWQEVARELRLADFVVYTPSLSGMGEHRHMIREDISLDTHITDIINLIEMEDLQNVVLVGHSYAGAVIAGVADRIPDRLNQLVFLDAMLVHDGESLHALQPLEVQGMEQEKIKAAEHLEPFSATLFGITEKEQLEWVSRRLTLQPFNTFAQALRLKNPYCNGLARTYIACINPQLPVMKKMAEEAQLNAGWTYYTLNTGHDAMLTAPEELTALFIKLVN